MSKKKKITIISVIAAIVLLAAAAAIYFLVIDKDEKTPSMQEKVNSRISAYETDLTDSLASMTDQEAVSDYLINWAKNKGIKAERDGSGNVIYSVPATEGFEAQPQTVIAAGYDHSRMNSYIKSLTCALTVAKNDYPHGEYKIIFVSEEEGSTEGIASLSEKHFKDGGRVFVLRDDSSSKVALATGGFHQYDLSKKLSYKEPAYDVAYEIKLSGLPSASFSAQYASSPNPVKTLGSLLANFKSTSILFELASFTGGEDGAMIPKEAAVTIVVNEDQAAKLEKNLENAIEKFYDKYADKFPEAQYTFETVDMPSKVISSQDTESIVSLLYTAISGIHYKDDNGDAASIANIGSITTDRGLLKIQACASSYDESLLDELASAYETISALTNVSYALGLSTPPFDAGEKGSLLSEEFIRAYKDYKSIDLDTVNMAEWTPALSISEKNDSLSIIALGVTEKTKDNFAGGLITYLKTPVDKEE